MTEPRYRILRLLAERQHAGKAGIPTMGEIAEGLGMSVRDVSLILKSSEAMGMVAIHRYMGASDDQFTVFLKSPAYIYLESHQPESGATATESGS
jgi:DNA-binding MarR family transcriptional regulator